jgi:hypothetical protein
MPQPAVIRKKYGRMGDLQYAMYTVYMNAETSGNIYTGFRTIYHTHLNNKTNEGRGAVYVAGSNLAGTVIGGLISGFYLSGNVFISGFTAGDVVGLMVWGQ